jgi:hypothetical protein
VNIFLSTVLNGRKRYAEGGLEGALDLKQAGRAATQEEAGWGLERVWAGRPDAL